MKVSDFMTKNVITLGENKTVDLRDLESGIYFLKIDSEQLSPTVLILESSPERQPFFNPVWGFSNSCFVLMAKV